jgi:hypothetical protein
MTGQECRPMNDPHDEPIHNTPDDQAAEPPRPAPQFAQRIIPPLPNYTLSTVCPACGDATVRRACKVRCERCGFTWDCSEL